MLTRKNKKEIIDNIAKKLEDIKSAVFVDFKGLSVSQLKSLRRELKKSHSELKVSKKTLIDLAFKQSGLPDISTKKMPGQVAIAFGFGDEVSTAKSLALFAKKNENLKIIGAFLDGKILGQSQAMALSKTPSKEQSLSRMIGAINAPLTNLVSVLGANMRNFVFVLSQIKK